MAGDIGDEKVVFLVSCVSKKCHQPVPAESLYTSTWFYKARHLVKIIGAKWYILSAEYGLLNPERVVAPYEKTLNTMNTFDRQKWAKWVQSELEPALNDVEEVVFFAGDRYREHLVSWLEQKGLKVHVPMQGLRIGQQLNWLDHAASNRSGALLFSVR